MPDNVTVQLNIEPVAVDSATFARMLSISPRHFAALEKSGYIGPRALSLGNSRRRLFSVDEIKSWCRSGCPNRIEWMKQQRNDNARS